MDKISKKKTITKLYDEYVSPNNTPTQEYIKLKDEFDITMEELMEDIPEVSQNKFERVFECLLKMCKEQEVSAFVEGYTLGTNLTTEAIHRGMK